MCLHLGVNGVVILVDMLVNEGLAHQVVRRVVEVLGGEGRCVYRLKAGIAFTQDDLFDQVHGSSL